MSAQIERRTEPRLRFCWEAYLTNGDPSFGHLGRMVDLSRNGAGLLVDNAMPVGPGHHLRLRFSYPRVVNGRFEMETRFAEGHILRTDGYNECLKKLAVRFDHPLDQCPATENTFPRCGIQASADDFAEPRTEAHLMC